MTEELGWSRTDISLGQTISTATGGIIGLFIGGLLDRRGGRMLMMVGAIVGGAGFMLLGQVRELWQYYAVKGVILTAGMAGMGPMIVNVAISNWFVRRRGRAIAISAMGLSVGAIFFPSIAAWLIDNFGWRTAWAAFGVSVWVVIIPAAALVMRRRPEDYGLEPDGGWRGGAPSTLDQRRAEVDVMRWTRREALRTPALWLLILSFGLASMGIGALLLHLIAYITDSGITRQQAAFAFGMNGVAGLIAKPCWGLAVERIRTRFVAAAMFGFIGVGIALLLVSPSLAVIAIAIFIFGIGNGGMLTVQETVWADYYGRLTLGTVRSVGRPFTIIFSAGGPVFAGAAYDLGGSYEFAFAVFIAASIAAVALILVTPEPRKPPRGEQPAAPEALTAAAP
jgi:sugar phosphate permease